MKKLISYIPNTITTCNLLSGVLAIIACFHGADAYWGANGYVWAMILIGVAAVFDFCDGLSARLLHAYSDIGKELDSLSDLVSFGVAPGLMVYCAMTDAGAGAMAYAALLIPAMGALRLARFNVDDSQATTFLGLPIPASAIFWIGAIGWSLNHHYPGNAVALLTIIVMSLMMVSNIRMFSLKFKDYAWRSNVRRYVLILAAIIFFFTDGVAGLAWTIVLYILISLLGQKNI